MLRDATVDDYPALLQLNQAFVKVLSPLDRERLSRLHSQAALFRVVENAGRMDGFLLALGEGASYPSLNYRWFAQRYRRFLYIDRIVIAASAQAGGLGTALYREAFAWARQRCVPALTCEFDIEPPNRASERFHMALGFAEVGRQVLDGGKVVSLRALDVAAGNTPLATG